jgi:tRNA(Ile)-lysidine synthase
MDADAVLPLSVRGRVPGDRMTPLGMGGRSKSLQDLFVDEAIPAERRPGWPIVLGRDGVAWVPGLRLDERAKVRPATKRVVLLEAVSGESPG